MKRTEFLRTLFMGQIVELDYAKELSTGQRSK